MNSLLLARPPVLASRGRGGGVAYVTGCHRMCKGDLSEAASIAPDIMANGLRVDYSRHGSACWAYYIDMVPARWRSDPLVIFEVETQRVVRVPIWLPQKADYAIMKMPTGAHLCPDSSPRILELAWLSSLQWRCWVFLRRGKTCSRKVGSYRIQ